MLDILSLPKSQKHLVLVEQNLALKPFCTVCQGKQLVLQCRAGKVGSQNWTQALSLGPQYKLERGDCWVMVCLGVFLLDYPRGAEYVV